MQNIVVNSRINETFYNEWLLTNQKGGYAIGYGNLVNQRKYHGLLIAADAKQNHNHLVASVEEQIRVSTNTMLIDSNSYAGKIYPHGYRHIIKSWLRPYPCLLYSAYPFDENVLLLKEIFMHPSENITLLRYTNVGSENFEYNLRYKYSLRSHHDTNYPGSLDNGVLRSDLVETDSGTIYVKRADNNLVVYTTVSAGELAPEQVIFRNNFYSLEASLGYEAFEDLFAPFIHTGRLKPKQAMEVLFSDSLIVKENQEQIKKEIYDRYASLPLPSDQPQKLLKNKKEVFSLSSVMQTEGELFTKKEYEALLPEYVKDFCLNDDVIAGYPWFNVWARSSLIFLEIFLNDLPPASDTEANGKKATAAPCFDPDFPKRMLLKYSRYLKDGLIPNYIAEGENVINYEAIDVSLWFVKRVGDFFPTLDDKTQRQLFEACEQIVLHYMFDKNLPFFMDEADNLLCIKEESGLALTWMDASALGAPVTPRFGKPIEINALFYTALQQMVTMCEALKCNKLAFKNFSLSLSDLRSLVVILCQNMKKFFIDGIWCDRIYRDEPMKEIRPNFVIALGVSSDFADEEGLAAAKKLAQEKLLTPYGLHTLATDSILFREKYTGNQRMRSYAAHQGSIWPWLLMYYAKLVMKMKGKQTAIKQELDGLVTLFRSKLMGGEYASLAELYDGLDPHNPKGAPAQAWSVAALYYIEKSLRRK